MTTAPPAVYGQFGQTLAFTERTLTIILRDHLAQRDITPETWYAVKLIATGGPGLSRQALSSDLAGSRNLDSGSTRELLARLESQGLISGDARVELTPEGQAMYHSLREHVGNATARLLDQFDLGDIETTVRTLQAITKRAAEEATSSAAKDWRLP